MEKITQIYQNFLQKFTELIIEIKRLSDENMQSVQNKNKKYENQTIKIINEFYADLYSLRNLQGFQWLLLPLFFVFIFLGVFLTIKIVPKSIHYNNDFLNILPMIFWLPAFGAYYKIIDMNEKNIIKKYNKKYNTKYQNIYDIKVDWLKNRFGNNYSVYELVKRLEEWKKYIDNYPYFYHFQWKKYTYHSEAKPRINGLLIALFSLSAILLINFFKPDNPDELLGQLFVNAIFCIILFCFIIAPCFYLSLYVRDVIRVMFRSVMDFFNPYRFSETKYQKLMAFLVQHLEVERENVQKSL